MAICWTVTCSRTRSTNSMGSLKRYSVGASVPRILILSSIPFWNRAAIASPTRWPGDSGPKVMRYRMFGFETRLHRTFSRPTFLILIKRHKSSRWWLVGFTLAAFLTNPFGHLGMLHLDIDTSIMPPILLMLAGAAILISRRFKLSTLIFLAGLQALAFWAKLTTPLLAPLSLAFRLRLDRKNWSILWIPAVVLLGGGALFALSWAACCSATGYPFQWIFTWISGAFEDRSTAGRDMVALFRQSIGLVYWFNPAFLALCIACTWSLFVRKYNGQESRDLKLIAVFGWSILLGYMVIDGMSIHSSRDMRNAWSAWCLGWS